MTTHVVVAAHGHCFDGLMSAAMFTHLRSKLANKPLRFSYKSCGYGPNMQTVPERWLKGDENAIVDFRFTDSQKLTWYFDHHVTAFASEQQREDALARSKRYHFDPTYGSCTKLIVDVGKQRYGVDFTGFEDLVTWADKIDRASYDSARDAIDRSHPVKQMVAVVEQQGDAPLLEHLVGEVLKRPLDEVANDDWVQERWRPIAAERQRVEERIASCCKMEGRVAFVDLHEAPLRASGKFVVYATAPECVYSVSLIRMKQHFKISLGYNPWGPEERRHDVGRICQRYGGGGHPVVGAISLPLSKLREARRVAREVVEELNG